MSNNKKDHLGKGIQFLAHTGPTGSEQNMEEYLGPKKLPGKDLQPPPPELSKNTEGRGCRNQWFIHMEPAEPGGFENSTFQLSIAVLNIFLFLILYYLISTLTFMSRGGFSFVSMLLRQALIPLFMFLYQVYCKHSLPHFPRASHLPSLLFLCLLSLILSIIFFLVLTYQRYNYFFFI